jgi:hypothetical protein
VLSTVNAWDLSEKSFGFRLQITDDRTTNFFPAAHPILSMNPACDDFTQEPPFNYKVLGGLVSELGSFDAGGWVSINSAIALIRLPGNAGTITPLLTRTDVYDSTTRQGQDFDLRTNAGTLRYSRRVSPNWSFGGAIKLLHNHTALADSALKVGSSVTKTEFTLGVLGSPVPTWTTGLFITQAPAWIDTKISASGGNLRERSTTLLTRVRGGISWRPLPDTGVYTDVQYLHIRSKDDSANFLRVMLMSEKFVTPTLPLRLGITVDSAGQATPTAGVGLYDFKGFNFDLYYSYNAYPEIRREVGKTNYWMIVLSRMF